MTSFAVRRAGLTLHVLTSLGWFGAVVAFLVLAVVGSVSPLAITVRGAYVSMDALARLVILPLCLASLVTGVVLSLISKWGLVRHYWVMFKLVLNLLSTLVLVGHMQPIAEVARAATLGPLTGDTLSAMRLQITLDAGAATIVLIAATVLAVYKPRGFTPYGWRKSQVGRNQVSAG
jgi:hypothetical protein